MDMARGRGLGQLCPVSFLWKAWPVWVGALRTPRPHSRWRGAPFNSAQRLAQLRGACGEGQLCRRACPCPGAQATH